MEIPAMIYVACLASYNNGLMHGRWIAASEHVEDMQEEVNEMLRGSKFPNVVVQCPECMGTGESFPGIRCTDCEGTGEVPSAEEWAIHDSAGLGDLGEYAGLEEVARRMRIVEVAEEYRIPPSVLFEAMADFPDEDPDDFMSDHYRGLYIDWGDCAATLYDETGELDELPDWARYAIDWDILGRHFELSGDLIGIEDGTGLYVFWAH